MIEQRSDLPNIQLSGGHVLGAAGALVGADVHIAGGVIVEAASASSETIDCRGLHIYPGIVDVHGDAFERDLHPRPHVDMPFHVAMTSVDRQLVANGITTAFHGLTLTWEPGARSRENGLRFLEQLASHAPTFAADHRVQLRWEVFAEDCVGDVIGWLQRSPSIVLAFNDHTTSTVNKVANGNLKKLDEWSQRAGLTPNEYIARVHKVASASARVAPNIKRIADAAQQAGAVMLSHDDRTISDRKAYRALGSTVCEFPLALDVARDAVDHGEPVILGAPNVVRGGSHTGALSAEDAIRDGLCTVLASDYYYPSQLQAVRHLAARGVMTFEDAWPLISTNAASAMGLDDRGTIEPGKRADLVVLDPSKGHQIVAALVNGRLLTMPR